MRATTSGFPLSLVDPQETRASQDKAWPHTPTCTSHHHHGLHCTLLGIGMEHLRAGTYHAQLKKGKHSQTTAPTHTLMPLYTLSSLPVLSPTQASKHAEEGKAGGPEATPRFQGGGFGKSAHTHLPHNMGPLGFWPFSQLVRRGEGREGGREEGRKEA